MSSLLVRAAHHATSPVGGDQAERAVVVGQVPDQVTGWGRAAGLAELLAQPPRSLGVGGVGDGDPAGPDPGVVGDHAARRART